MTKKKYCIKWTNKVVMEPGPDLLRLLEYIGTNEKGEEIKVYVYRVERIADAKK